MTFSANRYSFCVAVLLYLAAAAPCAEVTDQRKTGGPDGSKQKIKLDVTGTSSVAVRAAIDPIEFTQNKWHKTWPSLMNLKVAEEERPYAQKIFQVFVPDHEVGVGDTWPVDKGVERLLKQLNPGATTDMRIDNGDSTGRWAGLRAYDERLAEIVFRVHGQFVLEDGWFTVSQFAGRLVIDRASGNVEFFRLFVPSYALNFDVNRKVVLNSDEGSPVREAVATDAGYCPRIELSAGNVGATHGIRWTEQVSSNEMEHELALRFYRAWEIDWVELKDALALARRLKKPLHIVSADGPFRDESC